jgi:hypothetical protein
MEEIVELLKTAIAFAVWGGSHSIIANNIEKALTKLKSLSPQGDEGNAAPSGAGTYNESPPGLFREEV